MRPVARRGVDSTCEETEFRKVAVVGTGAIGASWTACFLARGLDVVATDPARGAEAALEPRGRVFEAITPMRLSVHETVARS